jgi:hypothetical protein
MTDGRFDTMGLAREADDLWRAVRNLEVTAYPPDSGGRLASDPRGVVARAAELDRAALSLRERCELSLCRKREELDDLIRRLERDPDADPENDAEWLADQIERVELVIVRTRTAHDSLRLLTAWAGPSR